MSLFVATLMLSTFPPQASALTAGPTSGFPGTVAFDANGLFGWHMPTAVYTGAGWFTTYNAALNHRTARVCRSPRTSGAQTLTAMYGVLRWDGSAWVALQSKTATARIPAGSACVTDPFRLSLGVNLGVYTYGGYFRVTAAFMWTDPYGNNLGMRGYVFGAQSDYRCWTAVRECQTGPGWIYLA